MASTHLAGKVITITGACGGIGRATALRLARAGAHLSLSDISAAALQMLADELQTAHPDIKLHTAVVDVSDSSAVNAWIRTTVERLGPLDGAANIAGFLITEPAGFTGIDDAEFDRVLRVNLYGTMHCMRAQLGVIRDGGSLVNMASIGGLHGTPGLVAYGASKAAVIQLTKSAAKEVAARGIRVNAIAPGMTDTPMLAEAAKGGDAVFKFTREPPMERRAQPDEIAALVVFMLGNQSRYMTGQVTVIDGGYMA